MSNHNDPAAPVSSRAAEPSLNKYMPVFIANDDPHVKLRAMDAPVTLLPVPVYLVADVEAALAEKDAEIARLRDGVLRGTIGPRRERPPFHLGEDE